MTTYPHPLGFDLRYLARAFGFAVRLHTWPATQVAQEDPHDHRFAFVSIPLRGTFLERRWRINRGWRLGDPAGLTRHACRPAVRGVRPPLERTGSDGLALDWHRLRRPLRPYRCALGEIHSYQPVGDGPHVSLVLLGRVRRETSNVWRRDDGGDR